jgi:hypothetical protein
MTDDYSLSPEDAAFVDRYVAELARREQDDIERQHGEFILEAAASEAQQERDKELSELFNAAWRAKLAKPERENEEGNQQ